MSVRLRLREAIRRHSETPWQYGQMDCAQFAGKVVRDVWGEDFLSAYRYRNRREYVDLVRPFGGLRGLVVSLLGEPDGLMRDGAVVMTHWNQGHALGIAVNGRGVFRRCHGCIALEGLSDVWGGRWVG